MRKPASVALGIVSFFLSFISSAAVFFSTTLDGSEISLSIGCQNGEVRGAATQLTSSKKMSPSGGVLSSEGSGSRAWYGFGK